MPKQKKGILGVKKDPRNQILFFSRYGEEWPSDDSEDSDYLPSDLGDNEEKKIKKKLKKDKGPEKKYVTREDRRKNEMFQLDICMNLPPLPTEIWLKIFQEVVSMAGTLPFLCRAQKVCTYWRDLAKHPSLWKEVDLSYGWIKMKEESLKWLCENRLSQCQDINMTNRTLAGGLRILAEKCPHLQKVDLSYCKKLTADGISALADNCTELRDIDVSNTGIHSMHLKDLVLKRHDTLQKIDISYNDCLQGFQYILEAIKKCQNLSVLDISNIGNEPYYKYITLDIEEFQRSCPNLQVLRMGNNMYKGVSVPDFVVEDSPGFPMLEEFMFPDVSGKNKMHGTITSDVCHRILHKSVKLKILDIRGRLNECYSTLIDLPADDVVGLHIGAKSAFYDDLYMELFQKWRHSLKTVDLSWVQNVELAMDILTLGPDIPLEHIQLTGSNITIPYLIKLVKKSPKLKYLQLESCRNLFRGIKRLYQGDDIEILKKKLNNFHDH